MKRESLFNRDNQWKNSTEVKFPIEYPSQEKNERTHYRACLGHLLHGQNLTFFTPYSSSVDRRMKKALLI